MGVPDSEARSNITTQAYRLLRYAKRVPSTNDDGTIDVSKLKALDRRSAGLVQDPRPRRDRRQRDWRVVLQGTPGSDGKLQPKRLNIAECLN
jgi:hypothetical protein